MSPIQRSDDPGRNLREVWLGPQNAWRWPFDATMAEWVVAIATFLLSFFVLWFVFPLGGLILLGSWALSRWFGRTLRTHRNWSRLYLICVLLFFVLLMPSPATWLLPMSWWMAIPGALIVAVAIVRIARPYLDGNRSFRYWLNTWQRVAHGPRPRRAPLHLRVATLDIPDDDPDDDEAKFMLAVLSTPLEEIRVPRYRRITDVEAMLWAPQQGRAETSTNVIVWLRNRAIQHAVSRFRYRPAVDGAGNEYEVLVDAHLTIGDTAVPNDTVITREVDSGIIRLSGRREFAETHQPVKELTR